MRRKIYVKTSLQAKPAPCIFKANHFHLVKSIVAWWRDIIRWITTENENDNDNDDDVDTDDDKKDQDSAPSQQQNQQLL